MNIEHLKGIIGELLVIIIYFFRAFRLLKWRYKSKTGEIDLILRRGRVIIFCEVKTRIGITVDMNHVEKIVSHVQMQRIKQSAEIFMKNSRYYGFDYQFNIAIVSSFLKIPIIIRL